jgi:hypothetical protein
MHIPPFNPMHYAYIYSGNGNGSSKKLCNIRIMHYYVMRYEQVYYSFIKGL